MSERAGVGNGVANCIGGLSSSFRDRHGEPGGFGLMLKPTNTEAMDHEPCVDANEHEHAKQHGEQCEIFDFELGQCRLLVERAVLPPLHRLVHDGDVDGADDAHNCTATSADLVIGNRAAVRQVPDVDQEQDDRGHEPNVAPFPPRVPDRATPDGPSNQGESTEQHTDLGRCCRRVIPPCGTFPQHHDAANGAHDERQVGHDGYREVNIQKPNRIELAGNDVGVFVYPFVGFGEEEGECQQGLRAKRDTRDDKHRVGEVRAVQHNHAEGENCLDRNHLDGHRKRLAAKELPSGSPGKSERFECLRRRLDRHGTLNRQDRGEECRDPKQAWSEGPQRASVGVESKPEQDQDDHRERQHLGDNHL
ncbi:hypothetical protein GQR58_028480 [Nymphon striatum]|nr:hypothetical protein GQR58_028480 [Nymphon striatum]